MIIVKKRNIEKIVSDSDLQKYLKAGFKKVEKKSSSSDASSNIDSNTKVDSNENTGKTLEEMKVPELKEFAKSIGISGYSNLTQAELIKVIRDHDGTDQQ